MFCLLSVYIGTGSDFLFDPQCRLVLDYESGFDPGFVFESGFDPGFVFESGFDPGFVFESEFDPQYNCSLLCNYDLVFLIEFCFVS
jgi:hypothetical protein